TPSKSASNAPSPSATNGATNYAPPEPASPDRTATPELFRQPKIRPDSRPPPEAERNLSDQHRSTSQQRCDGRRRLHLRPSPTVSGGRRRSAAGRAAHPNDRPGRLHRQGGRADAVAVAVRHLRPGPRWHHPGTQDG